jgi:hypothetical protein
MEIKIENRPSYAIAKIELTRKEKINAETNTVVSMTNGIKIETKVIEGENLFVNTFEALNDYEELILAPASVGDIDHINLAGISFIQQRFHNSKIVSQYQSVRKCLGLLALFRMKKIRFKKLSRIRHNNTICINTNCVFFSLIITNPHMLIS